MTQGSAAQIKGWQTADHGQIQPAALSHKRSFTGTQLCSIICGIIHFRVVCGCFCTTVAELSSWDKEGDHLGLIPQNHPSERFISYQGPEQGGSSKEGFMQQFSDLDGGLIKHADSQAHPGRS